MRFRLLYVESGNVVAEVDSYKSAYYRLRAVLAEHPELDADIGIQQVDEDGLPVGDLTVGIEVAGQQLQLH